MTKGYVYFIQSKGTENIKIGYTRNNVDKRLKQLQTGSDKELIVLYSLKGNINTEKYYHNKFSDLRIRHNNEWFDDSKGKIRNFIRLDKLEKEALKDFMNNNKS